MKVLVVAAHPEPRSFNTALRDHSIAHLRGQGHEVILSDLYAMQFNPVASAADFGIRADPDYLVYALEQRHGWQKRSLAPDILDEVDKLLWCDLLILHFPVFWFSTPAILKGWIDRVLLSGATYGGKDFYDRGRLAGRKAMVTVTLGGQRHMFGDNAVHGPLEDMLRHLLRGTLAYTGLTVLPPFVAWHVPYIDDAARRMFIEDYAHRLDNLAVLQPLKFPCLADFDERLYPVHGGAVGPCLGKTASD